MPTGTAAPRESDPRTRLARGSRFWRAWPRLCELCRQWTRQPICGACIARFAAPVARCPRCALPAPAGRVCGACLGRSGSLDRVVAAVDYGFPWDRLIARFKFRDQPELAAALAERLVVAVECAADPDPAARPDALDEPPPHRVPVERVVPIPLGPARLRERGYNQAWELARRIAERLALSADPAVLVRADGPAHQVGAGRSERERNLRDAFWVDPAATARIAGRHVAVVDDVMTTGATVEAAARALRRAGALQVTAWVLARTPATR